MLRRRGSIYSDTPLELNNPLSRSMLLNLGYGAGQNAWGDLTKKNNPATLSGATTLFGSVYSTGATLQNSKFGPAVSLGYATLSTFLSGQSFSNFFVSAWHYSYITVNSYCGMALYNSAGGGSGMRTSSNGNIGLNWAVSGTQYSSTTVNWNSGITIPVNSWFWVGLNITSGVGATVYVWKNQYLYTATLSCNITAATFSGACYVGNDVTHAAWNGLIADVRVYPSLISQQIIQDTITMNDSPLYRQAGLRPSTVAPTSYGSAALLMMLM